VRIAVYARVSTRDKDQNPETQLLRLRDFVQAHPDWHITQEYVDIASANDLAHRTAWRQLLDDAAKRRFDAVLVFKLDRAFRSVKHMHDTLAVWDPLHVGFLSAQEGFDTTTALGRLLLNLLASLAEFELALIRERVTAGMERARREGKHIGRPRVADDPAKARRLRQAVQALQAGQISYRQAAKQAGVALSTLQKALKEGGP
jgi:DNA invertase Pin-like site-specific DNA recombinase